MATGNSTSAEPSSSSTLWATASKEWVIQPKPKPGRKPRKDAISQASEVDATCRRVQNRAAQRAFRERKQSQLAELQARIKAYEQGEVEHNVALQKVAKRLKVENETLREENVALKARIAELEANVEMDGQVTRQTNTSDRKRSRDISPPIEGLAQLHKRTRNEAMVDYTGLSPFAVETSANISSTTPSDPVNFAESFPPMAYAPRHDSNTFNALAAAPSEPKHMDTMTSFPFTCGLCDSGNMCVCREIASQAAMEQSVGSAVYSTSDNQNDSTLPASSNAPTLTESSTEEESRPSVLNNVPPYQPAVPIRRRSKGVAVNSIFPVYEASQLRNSQAICSGDPSNCPACEGDSFGQAFCAAIGNSSKSCDCCAGTTSNCCGSSLTCLNCPVATTTLNASMPGAPAEMIPTNDAWQKLKAHPNVQFADLNLLAEVVASHSKCSGPRVVSPRLRFQDQPTNDTSVAKLARSSSPLRLVPQDVLLECGRRRMRHVHAEGVREALRFLDKVS